MSLLTLAALIAALPLLALIANGRFYKAAVERRWPAIGRRIDVGGARLHVIERGDARAPAILFLHGANSNAREFLFLAPELERTHRLLFVDRAGYGYSARPRGAERIDVQAALYADLIEREQAGPAVVVAHSLGCAFALGLARTRPDLVRGLVLIAPASHPYPGPNAWHARLAAAPLIGPLFCATLVPLVAPTASRGAVRNIFAPARAPDDYFDRIGVPLAFRPGPFRASARDVTASRREFALHAPLYGEIDPPAIVISADKDRVVSPRLHAQGLARDLQAVELVTLPGLGHAPHHLRPDIVLSAIARIETIGASRRAS